MSIYDPSGDPWFEDLGLSCAIAYSIRPWLEAIEAWFWNTP